MRDIPALLLAHLQLPVTTTCRLLRIQTQDSPPMVLGFTTLDQAVTYDDGDGAVVYSALSGFDPTAIRSDIGYSIDNAEAYGLISDDVAPEVTLEEIEKGYFDDATWKSYLINFQDTTMGHAVLDAGDVGQVRARFGMVWMPELLSSVVRLRQPIGHVDSLDCRAEFGTPAASQTGCGIDVTALWRDGEVTAVGAETDRVFDATIDPGLSPTPVPGRVQWLTGDNTSPRLAWVEAFEDDTVTLGEPTRWPIQVGDQFRIRPDCGKLYQRDCITIWNNGLNFKGEPYIPVGDAAQNQTPGAQLPGGGGVIGRVTDALGDDGDSP